MKEYTEKAYIETFGEKMWKEKVLDTLTDFQKRLGVDSVYATDLGNIFMVICKEGE
jgi:hypothetical protein